MMRLLRKRPEVTAWVTAAITGVIGLYLFVRLGDNFTPFTNRPFGLPFWGVAAIYAVAEITVIHLHSRRGAHALSLGEIGLVFGIATASPAAFIVGRALGIVIAHTVRGVAPIKVAFNIGTTLVGSTLALAIVHLMAGTNGDAIWPILLLAAAVDGLIASSTVAFIISVMNPYRTTRVMLQEIGVSWVEGMTVAVLAVVSYLLVGGSLTTIPLAVLMVYTLYRALRLYESLHRRNEELEALYSFTQQIEQTDSVHDLVGTLIHEIARQLRSERVTFLSQDLPHLWTVRSVDGGNLTTRPLAPSDAQSIIDWTTLEGRLEQENRHAVTLGPLRVTAPMVAAPVMSGDHVLGVIVASNRPGPDSVYQKEDRQFLKALGRHSGALLGRLQAERQLIDEVTEKQQIIRSKDQLIAAVSHELRTPLTGILGFAELLRGDDTELDDATARDMVDSIAAESLDLSHIVEDLLTAARFDLGGLATHCDVTKVDPLVRRVVETMSDRLDRSIDLETSPITALADAPRLRQVVRNLITNAVRYGGDQIDVRVAGESEHAVIEVRDNGVGIGDLDPEEIFAPYGSAHEPGTQPGSVGLGLTISRQLIRMMEGDLTFRRDNGWTVFRIELPMAVTTIEIEHEHIGEPLVV